MIIFNYLINFIESFIYPFFIANYFKISHKSFYIITITLINFVISNFFNLIGYNGLILSIITIIIVILPLFLFVKKFNFNLLFVSLLYYCIIVFTSLVSLYLFSSLFNIKSSIIGTIDIYYIIICLFAKVLLIVSTFIILKYNINLGITLDFQNWWLLFFNEIMILIAIIIISYNIITDNVYTYGFDHILILLILICFSSLVIVYKTSKINNEKILQEKQIQKIQYQKQNLSMIKDLKNEIDAIDHRLFYVLFRIEHLINICDYSNATKLIKDYRQVLLKQNLVIITGNDIFDCLFNLKIKELRISNINLKLCVNITEDDFYNDFLFINSINNLLNAIGHCENIEIFLIEKNSFVTLQIFSRELKTENKNIVEKNLIEICDKYSASYSINTDKKLKIIKLSIKKGI